MTFPVTQKPPTVFYLQASDWVHCEEDCEEETGLYYQLSQFTYKLLKKNYIFKVYFAKKNSGFSKNFIIFIISFFFKKR